MKETNKAGRHTKYDAEQTPRLAEEYAQEFLTDKLIAKRLGIHIDTYYVWIKKYPLFSEAIKRGREASNAELVKSMRETARGYYVTEEETTAILDGGKQPTGFKKTTRRRYIAPSTTMQIFMAKNRMPEDFRDVNKHEVTGANGGAIQVSASYDLSKLSEDELQKLRGILVKANANGTTDVSGD